jgi:hypothetical protein
MERRFHDWYASTIGSSTEGFGLSIEAGGEANRPLDFEPPQLYTSTPSMIGGAQAWSGTLNDSLQNSIATLRFNMPASITSSVNAKAFKAQASSVALSAPAQLWTTIAIPADAAYLSFNMVWNDNSNSDYLTLQFGDNVLFNFNGSLAQSGEMLNTGPIPLGDFDGQIDQLLFTLYSQGGIDTSVAISDLTFSMPVPEPTALVVFVGFLLVRRKGAVTA